MPRLPETLLDFIPIVLLGLLHGIQPDHVTAALGLAARSGGAAWRAALQLAAGHAGALVLAALSLRLLPAETAERIEPFLGMIAGLSLSAIGALLVLQVLRGRYVLHTHAHEHGPDKEHVHLHAHAVPTPAQKSAHHAHHHGRNAITVGLLLGLGGARGLVIVLPSIHGTASGAAAIGLYSAGIAAGVVLLCAAVDVLRRTAHLRLSPNALTLLVGIAAFGVGAHTLIAT